MLAEGLLLDSSTTHLTHRDGSSPSPARLFHIVTGLTALPLGPRQAPRPPNFLLSVKKEA